MGTPTEETNAQSHTRWSDNLAISLQELRAHNKISDAQPLIRIDCQEDAAQAPFQFDPVYGKLHRRDCSVISDDVRSALFARWSMAAEERRLACSHCRPLPSKGRKTSQDLTLDIFFGVISILDQFGTVLQERGKEYRTSKEGKELEQKLEELYSNLDRQQKDTLEVVLGSMDHMIKLIRTADQNLNQNLRSEPTHQPPPSNGNGNSKLNGNGHVRRAVKSSKNGNGRKRQATSRKQSR